MTTARAVGGSPLDTLLEQMTPYRAPTVFNQFAEHNPDFDRPDGAAVRLHNLRLYLEAFRDAAYVLVGEAPGYNGGSFSGVWFTDERFLVGPQPLPWVLEGGDYRRSSREEYPLRRELSSTIVWGALGDRRDIVFWPTFPWHPMGQRGPMSNRAPRRDELRVGYEILRFFLDAVFPGRIVAAIGRYAEAALQTLGYADVAYIRHPAQGGAVEFRAGIARLPRLDLS